MSVVGLFVGVLVGGLSILALMPRGAASPPSDFNYVALLRRHYHDERPEAIVCLAQSNEGDPEKQSAGLETLVFATHLPGA